MRRHRTSARVLSGLAVVVVAAAGCGADPLKTYPVAGRVVAADGKPVAGSGFLITFRAEVADGAGGTRFLTGDAPLGPDGAFRPSTFRFEDGLIAGTHSVTITRTGEGAPGAGPDAAPPAGRVPSKYQSEETSGLKAVVTPETTELVITVDANPS